MYELFKKTQSCRELKGNKQLFLYHHERVDGRWPYKSFNAGMIWKDILIAWRKP